MELPGDTGYASFVLMPLLNLLTNRRMVFVGDSDVLALHRLAAHRPGSRVA